MIGDVLEQAFFAVFGFCAFCAFYGYMLFRNSWRWRLLADAYAAPPEHRPASEHWTNIALDGVKFGWNTYGGVALIGISDHGLSLRLLPFFSALHPPLLIPESDITLHPTRWFFQDVYALELKRGTGVRILINPTALRWIERQRVAMSAARA